MTIDFNVTGKDRKALVQALADLTFADPVYAGAPSFTYQVGDYTVDKIGTVSYPDTVAPEAVALLVEKLKEQGFDPKMAENEVPGEIAAETPDVAPEAGAAITPEDAAVEATAGHESPDVAEESTEADQPVEASPETAEADGKSEDIATANADGDRLTISIPRDKLPDDVLLRLKQIVANKEELFKRAVSADALSIDVSEDTVSFPWFTSTGMDGEAAAYAQFITALCQMAKEQTRILDKPYDGDNDRFAMRIFMVRLGMKGAEFALARKLMMKNLSGNSGWRYGAPPKKETHDDAIPSEQEAPAETDITENTEVQDETSV